MLAVSLGRLLPQAILGAVALQTNLLGSDQFHNVHRAALLFENLAQPGHIVPVRLFAEGPHIGENHAVVVRPGEFLKHHLAQPVHRLAIIGAEELDHRLDAHVVVEQFHGCNLRQLLAHSHLAHSLSATQKQ